VSMMLQEGDRVKFRCDSFGRPIYGDSGLENWNTGIITKVFGKKDHLYCMTVILSNKQPLYTAINYKNWPLGLSKLLVI